MRTNICWLIRSASARVLGFRVGWRMPSSFRTDGAIKWFIGGGITWCSMARVIMCIMATKNLMMDGMWSRSLNCGAAAFTISRARFAARDDDCIAATLVIVLYISALWGVLVSKLPTEFNKEG